MEYLNEELNCNGYCFDQLFAWNIPIKEGRPLGTCVEPIKREMYLVFMFPAIVALIGSIISGITLPIQYLLWKRYPARAATNKSLQKIEDAGIIYTDGMGNPEPAS